MNRDHEPYIRRIEMNRRTFLTATTGAATLAANLTAVASPGERKKVLIPDWEPERIEDLKAAVPGVELIIAGDSLEQVRDVDAAFGFIDAAHIRAGQRLRWVQQGSAGVEGVVTIPELVERDIVLTNMQRTFAPEIADQAIAYLLAFTRGLTHVIRKPPEGAWRRPPEVVLDELQGKTLLVIALGGIGSEIARRAFGFGMRVLATDPKVIEKPLFVEELHKPDAFHRLLPRADVVASAVPLTPLSRRMIGEREFGMMKRGVILINVSRGGVVDTDALVAALDQGRVAAAGLDVTDPEPLPAGHPLWTRNVLITPHTAGQSPGGQRRAHELFRENLRRFAAGEMLLNIVDKKAGY
jgi:phosphoglycerate dehydrogenase-like enzyme